LVYGRPTVRGRFEITLLLLACSSCATTRLGATGAPVSADWLEVNTPHVRMWAELEEIPAEDAARSLETLRSAVAAFWGPEFDPPDLLEVVLFRDPTSLAPFAPRGLVGFVSYGRAGPVMVTSAASYEDLEFKSVQAHELAHHLSAYAFLRQPRWLAEGLATYLESLELQEAGTQVLFGKSPQWLRPIDLLTNPVTVDALWRWARPDLPPEMAYQYYSKSWWVVHHLLDSRGAQFEAFRRKLEVGTPPRAAWDQSFAGLTDAALEAELATALTTNARKTRTARVKPKTTVPKIREVSPAEIPAIRAELLSTAPIYPDRAERKRLVDDELGIAFGQDPSNERALLLECFLLEDDAARLAFLREVVVRVPTSGRLLGMLAAELASKGEDSTAMFDRALVLAPTDTMLLNNVAWDAALRGHGARAIELSERAVAQRPYLAHYVDTLAAALAVAGRCPEALTRQQQAIDLLGHSANEATSKGYLSRLALYAEGCSPEKPVRLQR
jgi:hypothetical protein